MSEENKQKGGISVDSEHIFPIIKKWLYSEKDIFLREIVSNATDAVTKIKRLRSLGELEDDGVPFRIDVVADKAAGTLTVKDNGIGMTGEEVRRYICSIALSGAVDFIAKYEKSGNGEGDGIIGHFGLGFYSAFMVSDSVEIVTRSYTGAPAVHWVCSGEGEYEMEETEKEGRGTEVIMHIAQDEKEYLESGKILEMLRKYCAFMPVEIYFSQEGEEKSANEKPINDTHPLWQKPAKDCTKDEYNEFYKKVFGDYRDPLLEIHLNADYPLNFKGILYFPRINSQFEPMEGQVKLYYNQVFVADNIKEVIPDYLLMLRGVLDCPELPLNVSRSYLQTNTYVGKLSAYIVKKVADKLNALCRGEREQYEKIFDDIRTFVEYACVRDGKFYDRVKESVLLRLVDGRHMTVSEYLDAVKEKAENKIFYATDRDLQAQYIALYEAAGLPVCYFDSLMDTQFIPTLEAKNEGVRLICVDAEIPGEKKEADQEKAEALRTLFRTATGNDKLKVETHEFENGDIPALLNVTEESRRMEEMMRLYRLSGGAGENMPFDADLTLTLNTASRLILALPEIEKKDPDKAKDMAACVYRLALLSKRRLSATEMKEFLTGSYKLLSDLAADGTPAS